MNFRNALLLTAGLSILAGCVTTDSSQQARTESARPPAAEAVTRVESPPERPAEAMAPVAEAPVMEVSEPLPESVAPDPVDRISVPLKKGSARRLREMDRALDLSNAQYNAIVAILADRDAQWDLLLSKKAQLPEKEFALWKREIFKEARELYESVWTPEQAKVWSTVAK